MVRGQVEEHEPVQRERVRDVVHEKHKPSVPGGVVLADGNHDEVDDRKDRLDDDELQRVALGRVEEPRPEGERRQARTRGTGAGWTRASARFRTQHLFLPAAVGQDEVEEAVHDVGLVDVADAV